MLSYGPTHQSEGSRNLFTIGNLVHPKSKLSHGMPCKRILGVEEVVSHLTNGWLRCAGRVDEVRQSAKESENLSSFVYSINFQVFTIAGAKTFLDTVEPCDGGRIEGKDFLNTGHIVI